MARCTKQTFAYAGQARYKMRRLIATGHGEGDLHVYQCKACGGWHFGHRTGAALARMNRLVRKIDAAIARDRAMANGNGGGA